MEDLRVLFQAIADKLYRESDNVDLGKMMSHPGLNYKGRVFAFYAGKDEMVFKLGKDFDPKAHGIDTYSLLSPFNNKPPMAAWFCIPSVYADKWEALARIALSKMAG